MEQHEIDLIQKFSAEDNELKALWDQHVEFERQLGDLSAKSSLSEVEEAKVKELKKKKLAGKTRLQTMLEKYRSEG